MELLKIGKASASGYSDWFFLGGFEKCVRVDGQAEPGHLARIRDDWVIF